MSETQPDNLREQRPYDAVFMRCAIELAESGRGRVSPNPLVGALVVDETRKGVDGLPRVLAEGFHARLGGPHAEVAALQRLDGRAVGHTLYVSLEPCNHVGRTGRCTDAIVRAGIRRVVIGMRDCNPHVTGHGIECLRDAGVSVLHGVEAAACERQNHGFVLAMRHNRPSVLLKAAVSLDGRVMPMAGAGQGPVWLTGTMARQAVHHMRNQTDAILVGAGTVAVDDPQLTVRLHPDVHRDGRQPLRVVLDGALRIDSARRCYGPGTLIVISAQTAVEKPQRVQQLQALGCEVLSLPAEQHQVSLPSLLSVLATRGIHWLLCEGGPTLHTALLQAQLVDRAALFVAPVWLGEGGLPMLQGTWPGSLPVAPWLANVVTLQYGQDVLLEGNVRYGGFAPIGQGF